MQKEEAGTLKKKSVSIFFLTIGIVFLGGTLFYFLRMSAYKENLPASEDRRHAEGLADAISSVRVADDGKSVIAADTGETIFTIEAAQEYLDGAHLAYNADTFETTNDKYSGSCFGEAVLSNDRQKIIFSTSCLPGDMSEAWVGVYEPIEYLCLSDVDHNGIIPSASACMGGKPHWGFRFLQSGGGNNFVWSADDKSVIYDSTLGLTGWSLEKTIEVAMEEAVVTETCDKYKEKGMDSKDACYKLVAREKEDESVCAQIGLPEMRSECYLELAKLKNDFDICWDNHLTAALDSDCAEYFGKIDKTEAGTVGLKRYWNTDLVGYEISFPADWSLEKVNGRNISLSFPGYDADDFPEAGEGSISVIIEDNSKELDLQSWLAESEDYYSQSEADQIEADLESGRIDMGIGCDQKDIMIDSRQGIDQQLNAGGGAERHIFVPVGKYIVRISLESDGPFERTGNSVKAVQDMVEIFNRVLSTFRFL